MQTGHVSDNVLMPQHLLYTCKRCWLSVGQIMQLRVRRPMAVVQVQQPADGVRLCMLMAGRRIPLRPGAVALLQSARRRGVPTHVLSVGWSAEMLQGALRGRVPVSLK